MTHPPPNPAQEPQPGSNPAADPLRPEVAALFRQGVALHRQGQLAQARLIYEQVLANQAHHFDALHLSGVIAAQSKDPTHAIELIGKAIQINPGSAAAHSNRGNALHALGRFEEAVASHDEAIALNPHYAEAHSNRGNALRELKRWEEAVASYDRAIALAPGYADAYSNRGNALLESQRLVEAVASYDRAIAIRPDHAVAHYNRGNALHELGRPDEALASYDRAIAIKPDYAEPYANSGSVLQELKRVEEAVSRYDRAIALKPDYAEAHYNRGKAFHELKRMEEAVASCDRAIAIRPDYAEAHYNRGNALYELNRMVEAVASYDRAIAIKPDHAEAHYNRGNALHQLNRVKEAVASFDRAIAVKPDYTQAHWNKSIALLLGGEFTQGWALHEWRWKRETFTSPRRDFPAPLWLGEEDIAGKSILLHSEQGLGDTIQFCRYARLVKARGARVILEVPRALLGLLGGLDGVDELIEMGSALPAFDYHCPLMSLPLAFKTELTHIPTPQPYLAASPRKREEWAQRLGAKVKPRVGLAWSGNAEHQNDHNRSVPLHRLLPHLSDGCEFVSLQKEVRDVDKPALQGCGIRHYGESLEDFTDTAALCELMDLVISVDTSVAHLAGAMGKATWVLLPYAPDWRWLLDRDDSPWYESVRLYRQDMSGDWPSVLEKVMRDLDANGHPWA